MCLITYAPAGVELDLDVMWEGMLQNPDGHGFAVATGRHVIVSKGMDGAGTVRIVNEAQGVWHGGCWYSNEYALPEFSRWW